MPTAMIVFHAFVRVETTSWCVKENRGIVEPIGAVDGQVGSGVPAGRSRDTASRTARSA